MFSAENNFQKTREMWKFDWVEGQHKFKNRKYKMKRVDKTPGSSIYQLHEL